MGLLLAVQAPLLIMAVAVMLPSAYAEVVPTDGGTLNVRLTTDPQKIVAGQEIKVNVDFLNPATQDTQIHIDYFVTVLEDGSKVFGPTNRIHTSEGRGSIPIQFQRDGEYEVKVDVDGILFNPIPMETAVFALTVGDGEVVDPAVDTPTPPPPDVAIPKTNGDDNGCLIATAAFGTEMADEVQMLREIRDHSLLATRSGTAFMAEFNQIYYSFSPTVADWERQSPAFREAVRVAITPLLASLSVLDHASMDSEAEVLGYGIGIIVLNMGMYAGLPVAGLWAIQRSKSRRLPA